MAVPADVEPAVDRLDDVFRYELDDLERAAMQGRSTRAAAASAPGLIDEAVAGFWGAARARAAVPAIVALRQHFEVLREEVLAERPADAAAATRLLINRLLHEPSEVLREMAARVRPSGRRPSVCWPGCSVSRSTSRRRTKR